MATRSHAIRVDPREGIAYIVTPEFIECEALADVIREVTSDADFKPGTGILLDARCVEESMSHNKVYSLALLHRQGFKGHRTAIVVDSDGQLGTCNMLCAYASDDGSEMRTFTSLPDALAWLKRRA